MRLAPDYPLHRTALGEGETYGHIGIQVVREGVLARVDQGEVRFAGVDVLERIRGGRGRLDPLQVRGDGMPHPLEQVLLGAPGTDGEARRFQLQGAPRSLAIATVDHQLRDTAIGCRSISRLAPLVVRGDLSGGNVRAPGGEGFPHGIVIGYRVDDQLDAQLSGELPRDLELQAFRALGAQVVARRDVQRDDLDLPALADPLQRGGLRLAAGQLQNARGGD